ncbi:hypothetical protein BFR88_08355 [Acinetobacter pittii]|uniref:glycosyltransferase family 2 protein n=2 Tax=Acinetobacter pittii TaxID=48296 RepID=UPI00083985DE|nr:glycosyltransferase family A protein [Acinetobacter pittii]OCY73479.1 hypothetical protein BFR86_06645 [Acinetobacter pittii]OCY79086.1 hypothetical protein BFR88_08355 [Acinetobacter pittii]
MDFIPGGISVVIPTYNRAHLIKESLQSVLDQTVLPLEIIVVDDFSTDNTEEVVKYLNSPLIKYFKNQRTKGANGARNTGIMLSCGEFIAFHDSDDTWLPKKLELQLQAFKAEPDVGICFCSLIRTRGEGNQVIFPKKYISSPNELVRKVSIASTQTLFTTRLLAQNVLFDESIKRFQDWDFVLRVSYNHKLLHLNIPLVNQNIMGDSISSGKNLFNSLQVIYAKHPLVDRNSVWNKIIEIEANRENGSSSFIENVLWFFLKIKLKFKKEYI